MLTNYVIVLITIVYLFIFKLFEIDFLSPTFLKTFLKTRVIFFDFKICKKI